MATGSWVPQPKVAAAGGVGGLALLALWAAHRFAGIDVPEDVAAAAVAGVMWLTAYLKPDKTDNQR